MNDEREQQPILEPGSSDPLLTPSETWLDIPGYEGTLQASSLGRIRRLEILPGSPCGGTNYLAVTFKLGKDKLKRNIHRLVAAAFHGIAPPRMVVDHKDGNKHNNSPGNLEYVTHQENTQRAYKLGLIQHALSPEQMDEVSVRYNDQGQSLAEISREMGITFYQAKSVITIWRMNENRKGEDGKSLNPHARKVDQVIAKQIRKMARLPGMTNEKIAKVFKLDPSHVGRIIRGERHKQKEETEDAEEQN